MHHYVSLFLKLETLDALTTMTTYHSSNTHDWLWAELNKVENCSQHFLQIDYTVIQVPLSK